MDKAILKKFAIESRQDLMEKIKNKINTFYIDEEFKPEQKGDLYILSNNKHSLSLTNDEYKKRELLIKRINELGIEQVIEEAAYTWFNRIVAIRYMEINDYLPLTKDNQSLGIRVLSSKDNTPDPEILKFTNLTNPDLDIDFKKEKYVELKEDNEKFKYVLLLVCKKIGRVIPQVFDGITDYIDILIPDNLLNDTGFVNKIVNEVPEDNYNQVEIIGWLYQYYNQTEKDRVISAKKQYKKNEIAYATQLFTPDWIVKYMVENSLGRYWVEHGGDKNLIQNWKYFIKDNIQETNEKITPTEIKCIDPCSGSGHILVYMFEVLYQIYLSYGYSKNDIAEQILKNNLYGLDIDDRAGQLSILSILLKAREYDKSIFNKELVRYMNIMSIQESNVISSSVIENIKTEQNKEYTKYLIDIFKNAKEIGSLLIIESKDYGSLEKEIDNNNTIFGIELSERIIPLIKIAKILSNKYDVVITNPPYMGGNYMNATTSQYINKFYKKESSDMCVAFIKKCLNLKRKTGYTSMVTAQTWMFLSSFTDFRIELINHFSIINCVHLGSGAFDAGFGTTSFVIGDMENKFLGEYIRLVDFTRSEDKEDVLINLRNNKKYIYFYDMENSLNIAESPICYWISNNILNAFKNNNKLDDCSISKKGVITGNDSLFIRAWYEVKNNDISVSCINYDSMLHENPKYVFQTSSGFYRKWYGCLIDVIDMYNDGEHIKNTKSKCIRFREKEYYFRKGIAWSKFSAKVTFRYIPTGILYADNGPMLFANDLTNNNFILGFLNSNICQYLINMLNPSIATQIIDIKRLPIIFEKKDLVGDIVNQNISISKEDWDSFETSWDFIKHPLIEYKSGAGYADDKEWNFRLNDAYESWKSNCDEKFKLLKNNEEELNRIFIDIYGLHDELTPDVEDKDITIRKADREREIKSLISYAVGCMFGRYSLNQDGLVYAGGDFDKSKYKTFSVDEDNIIPITDEAYFGDDIVERFKKFIRVVYGNNTFNENIDFVAETLGKKGTETSEDTIRRYFVNDFFNDHCKVYQKRPIYWLLDSGKKNGFKALIYMHRYNENLIPKARLDYLHRIQTTYEKLLSDVNYKLTTDLSMTDKKEAQKKQADLNTKLQEIKEYDEKIAHIANQRISIDLDDGVKENYAKFEDILAKIK